MRLLQVSRAKGHLIVLLLYVNDILIASNSKPEVQKVKAKLNSKFEMRDLGATKNILRIEIIRRRDLKCLHLSQKTYLKKILEKYSRTNLKSKSTPLASYYKLSDEHSPKKWRNNIIWTVLHNPI